MYYVKCAKRNGKYTVNNLDFKMKKIKCLKRKFNSKRVKKIKLLNQLRT